MFPFGWQQQTFTVLPIDAELADWHPDPPAHIHSEICRAIEMARSLGKMPDRVYNALRSVVGCGPKEKK